MKAERLFRAIGLVDEGLIEAAAETPAKKRPVWRRYAAAAACLMVLCGAGAVYLITGGFRGYGASAGGSGIDVYKRQHIPSWPKWSPPVPSRWP